MNDDRPEGFRRVSEVLATLGHPHAPQFLDVTARTAQEAADALGVQLGQIAKSVVFKRKLDGVAVLVVTSGDLRVDVDKVAGLTGALGRADADFAGRAPHAAGDADRPRAAAFRRDLGRRRPPQWGVQAQPGPVAGADGRAAGRRHPMKPPR
jgi:hypothetical protein